MSFCGYNLGAGSTGSPSLARSSTHHPFMTSRRSMPSHIGSMDRRDDAGSSSNYNPFLSTHQGPTQFQPVKLGIRPGDSRLVKPPKAPEKPLMPYMRYHRKVWDEVKRTQPDAKLWEIGKIIGQKWRELPEEQKAEFNAEFEAEKAAYNEALKQYHNSPAYQAYLVAKSRQEQLQHEESESHIRAKMAKVVDTDISIQPAEDDDDPDDGFSVKHAAAARYHRNQRLLVDIFSEVSVPDVRGIVTSHRIATLRGQVHSLEVHQKKLEDELEVLEERHENKKKDIEEGSKRFDEEAAQLLEEKPEISEEMYNKMYDEACKELKEQATKTGQLSGLANGTRDLPIDVPSTDSKTESAATEQSPQPPDPRTTQPATQLHTQHPRQQQVKQDTVESPHSNSSSVFALGQSHTARQTTMPPVSQGMLHLAPQLMSSHPKSAMLDAYQIPASTAVQAKHSTPHFQPTTTQSEVNVVQTNKTASQLDQSIPKEMGSLQAVGKVPDVPQQSEFPVPEQTVRPSDAHSTQDPNSTSPTASRSVNQTPQSLPPEEPIETSVSGDSHSEASTDSQNEAKARTESPLDADINSGGSNQIGEDTKSTEEGKVDAQTMEIEESKS